MPNNRIVAGLGLALSLFAIQASAQDHAQRIPRAQIDAMFADMKAHAPWDLSGDLLWGYFFTGSDKAALESAAKILTSQGYRFVDIHPLEGSGSQTGARWQLHVERVEHHTTESLFRRNADLYAFADSHRLASYDGMDVGPVTPTRSHQ